MTISATCDCGKAYRVRADKAGQRFKCRECGTLVQVPEANEGGGRDNDDEDDLEMEPNGGYVPAHRRAAEKARSKKEQSRQTKRAATIKRWMLILGSLAVVIGGFIYAIARFPQVMLKILAVDPFVFQFLLIPTILFFLGQWHCRRRIRDEIQSHDGIVTRISWQPLQGLPFTKMWGFGIHPIGGSFFRVTYTDREGRTQQSFVGFTARGMRWDGDI